MLGPARDPERRPARERAEGRIDGELDLAISSARDLGEHLLVDWRAVLEAGGRGDAPPADEVLGRDGNSGDQRPAHAANSVALASTTTFPPSTASTLPVTNEALGELSQATASAISSGLPGLRSGTCAETLS